MSGGNNFGSFYREQNVHQKQKWRQFMQHYVRGSTDTLGHGRIGPTESAFAQ